MKYDFKLDLNKNNSLSLILSRIKQNTSILEFGCANGRLTKYLSEEMKCKVTVVEIEEEAGKDAKPFAVDALLGDIDGNIENYTWCERLKGKTFDFIIFADVLEHLRDPESVLKKCKYFLSDGGSILVSIPNIANNSIIINLLQDEFEYQEIGLLDNTHIKFYTRNTFHRMLGRLNYKMIFESGTFKKIGEDEFNINYQTLSPLLKSHLMERDFGDIYQYIFQFENPNIENNKPIIKMYPSTKALYYQSVAYYMKDGVASETQTVCHGVKKGINEIELTIKEPMEIRFDPINTSAIIRNIEIKDDKGNTLAIESHNAEIVKEKTYYFANLDPNFIFHVNLEQTETINVKFEIIDLELSNDFMNFIMKIKESYSQLVKNYEQSANLVEDQQSMLTKNNEDIINLNNIVRILNGEIENLRSDIDEKNKVINELTGIQAQLDSKIHDYKNRLHSYNSKKYHIKKI